MTIDLAPLLRPRSVAVLAASDRPSPGRMIIEGLDRIGFPGPVYPVNLIRPRGAAQYRGEHRRGGALA